MQACDFTGTRQFAGRQAATLGLGEGGVEQVSMQQHVAGFVGQRGPPAALSTWGAAGGVVGELATDGYRGHASFVESGQAEDAGG